MQSDNQTQTLRMYRAIRMFNGGEQVEFAHFQTLAGAYNWLRPTNEIQLDERWHIKLLPAIRQDIEERNFKTVTMGFNEMLNSQECTIYIQIVERWDTALPNF